MTLGGGPLAGLALDVAGGGRVHELFLTYTDRSEGDKIIMVDATDLKSGAPMPDARMGIRACGARRDAASV